jgi:hypothetical protein
MYDDYMLCKVTLGVLKGTSKLNALLLLLLLYPHANHYQLIESNVAVSPYQSLQAHRKQSGCIRIPITSIS